MVLAYSYKRNKPRRAQDSPTPLRFALLAQPVLVTRKNQKAVESDFPDRFKAAIQTMISQGNYSRIVDIHADMDHRMHSMNGPVGTRRFLPWHRIYLTKFEAELRIVDAGLCVPYWDWANDRAVPSWLADFLPQGTTDLSGNPIVLARFPGTDPQTPDLPTQGDVDAAAGITNYLDFTAALEEVHNTVHNWVGGFGDDGTPGTMADIMYSPSDPLFWMHHAFIDLQWARWQVNNPGQIPPLTGPDRILDPWAETVDDAMSIAALGYAYA
jgi:tyrosinase